MVEAVVLSAVGLAIFFAFWNGFTDAANAIATIVGTRVLKPVQAVTLSAIGNFVGMVFGVEVVKTIARGIIPENLLSSYLVIAVLIGGLMYDVITWYFGLPISESHVLIGGLIGAGIGAAGISVVKLQSIVDKVLIPMVSSPFIAFVGASGLTVLVIRLLIHFPAERANKYFGGLQIVSSFFFSVTHGTNDAQKTMGVIVGILAFHGYLSSPSSGEFLVPFWVILAAHASISLGTFLGGWRIVRTMAMRITRLRPYQGFCAETGGAAILAATAVLGFPVSTTHAISGAIMGVGATRRVSAVKWGMARRIVWAWILTIPMAAIFAFSVYKVIALML